MGYATVRVSERQMERAKKITGKRSAQAIADYAMRLLVLRGYAKDEGSLKEQAIEAIRRAEPQMTKPPTRSLFLR